MKKVTSSAHGAGGGIDEGGSMANDFKGGIDDGFLDVNEEDWGIP